MSSTETNLNLSTGSGALSARLSLGGAAPEAFEAAQLDVHATAADVQVWGMTGDEHGQHRLILLNIPADLPKGCHAISPMGDGSISAALATDLGAAWATGGTVELIEWLPDHGGVKLKFDFAGAMESGDICVAGGELDMAWQAAPLTALEGTGSAVIQPPVFTGHEQVSPTAFYAKESAKYHRFDAVEHINGSAQGVILFIPSMGDQVGNARAFYLVNHGLYMGENLMLENLSWDKTEKRFETDFTFDFKYAGKEHSVRNGKVLINYGVRR